MAASKRPLQIAPKSFRDNTVVRGAGGARPAPRPKEPVRKAAASKARAPARARKATTLRLDPALLRGLELLQDLQKKPLNRLINEAVHSYVARRYAEVEGGLQDILDRVRAYRRIDPDFDKMWAEFVDAEARYGAEDPVEGSPRKSAGPAQALVRNLLQA